MQTHAPEFIGVRRDIHRHPELGLSEHRTSELVANRLAQWGYEVTRGLATTGVVGTLSEALAKERWGSGLTWTPYRCKNSVASNGRA
jgi:hippurate hydrolase